jgi:hypothetical protein
MYPRNDGLDSWKISRATGIAIDDARVRQGAAQNLAAEHVRANDVHHKMSLSGNFSPAVFALQRAPEHAKVAIYHFDSRCSKDLRSRPTFL